MSWSKIEEIARFYGYGKEQYNKAKGEAVTYCPCHDDYNGGSGNPGLVLTTSFEWNGLSFGAFCRTRGCHGLLERFIQDGMVEKQGSGPPRIKHADMEEWIHPITEETPPPPSTVKIKTAGDKTLTASRRWAYLDIEGKVLAYVLRFDYTEDDGSRKKETLPQVYGRTASGKHGWCYGRPPGARLVYGLEKIAKEEKKPLLIVEGEKTADAAQTIFSNFYTLTWQGGSGTFSQVDWKKHLDPNIIGKRRIVIWPDADVAGRKWSEPGFGAKESLPEILQKMGHDVKVVDVWNCDWIPQNGWDLADDIPNDRKVDELFELLERACTIQQFNNNLTINRCGWLEAKIDESDENPNEEQVKKWMYTRCQINASSPVPSRAYHPCLLCTVRHCVSKPADIQTLSPLVRDYVFQDKDGIIIRKDTRDTMTITTFKNTLGHIYPIGSPASADKLFLGDPEAARVFEKMLWPGRPFIYPEGGRTFINAWKPPKINVIKHANTPFLLKWLEKLFEWNFPDEGGRKIVRQFLAHLIMKPGQKVMWAPIVSSVQGTGKDSIMASVIRLIGKDMVKQASDDDIKSQFIDLALYQLVIFQETNLRTDWNTANKLKPIITNPDVRVELKGKQPYNSVNHSNLVVLTNAESPIPLEPGDRRWYLYRNELHHAEAKKFGLANKEQFQRYWENIDAPAALSQLYEYYSSVDLSDFVIARAPDSIWKDAAISMNVDSVEEWLRDLIVHRLWPIENGVTTLELIESSMPEHLKTKYKAVDFTKIISKKLAYSLNMKPMPLAVRKASGVPLKIRPWCVTRMTYGNNEEADGDWGEAVCKTIDEVFKGQNSFELHTVLFDKGWISLNPKQTRTPIELLSNLAALRWASKEPEIMPHSHLQPDSPQYTMDPTGTDDDDSIPF